MERVCVIGAGAIGSLFAGHLAAVADVSILTRRPEQAAALEREGLRISGRSERQAPVRASADPDALQPFDLGIVATKAGGSRRRPRRSGPLPGRDDDDRR